MVLIGNIYRLLIYRNRLLITCIEIYCLTQTSFIFHHFFITSLCLCDNQYLSLVGDISREFFAHFQWFFAWYLLIFNGFLHDIWLFSGFYLYTCTLMLCKNVFFSNIVIIVMLKLNISYIPWVYSQDLQFFAFVYINLCSKHLLINNL